MSFSGLTGIPDAIRLANGGVGSWSISELTINGEPVCSSAAAGYGNFDIVFDRFLRMSRSAPTNTRRMPMLIGC
jgi:hypothetical protein